MSTILTIIAILIAIHILTMAGVFFYFSGMWTRALMAGQKVSIYQLIGMKLRRVDPEIVLNAFIKAQKAEIDVSLDQLEAHYLAGGSVNKVVSALVKAHARDIPVPFKIVAKTDLAGFDLDEVNPEDFRKALEEDNISEPPEPQP